MRTSYWTLASTILALAAGNFAYQFAFASEENWASAFERSWFQAVALGTAWFLWRLPKHS